MRMQVSTVGNELAHHFVEVQDQTLHRFQLAILHVIDNPIEECPSHVLGNLLFWTDSRGSFGGITVLGPPRHKAIDRRIINGTSIPG